MTTAAEQYRKLVAKLEEINDPRSQEERDSQMANFKGAYKDYQDAEDEKAKAAQKPAAAPQPAAPASPVSGDVKQIQTLLNTKGAQLTVDGQLGSKTLAAILKHLQSETQATQPPKWSIDGKPVQSTNTATSPANTVGSAPGSSAADAAQNMVSNALSPWGKGQLFNR